MRTSSSTDFGTTCARSRCVGPNTVPKDINLIEAEFRREKRAIEARRQMEQAETQG